jgi:nucleoside-diphosphate-sugar epimerase
MVSRMNKATKLNGQTIALTGGTGLIGSHVATLAVANNLNVRVLVRPGSDTTYLRQLAVTLVEGTFDDEAALFELCRGADHVINCAAKVGDWGKLSDFRRENVFSLTGLLDAASLAGVSSLVHVSSLGVYEPVHHFGTDESVLPAINSLDGYTRSKTEAEMLVLSYGSSADGVFVANYGNHQVMLPHALQALRKSNLAPNQRLRRVAIVRPGFVYGERDRTVLPKLLTALESNRFYFFGDGRQALNSVYAGKVAEAIFACLADPETAGEVFNVTDGIPVTKFDFVSTVAEAAGMAVPHRSIPLPVAKALADVVHEVGRMVGLQQAPLINKARYKFLGLNLDFSIAKATESLGYSPTGKWRESLFSSVESIVRAKKNK